MNSIKDMQDSVNKKAWNRLNSFIDVNLDKVNAKKVENELKLAKICMQLAKELNIQKRSFDLSHQRIAKLLKEDKKEILKRIKQHLPEYEVK